MAASQSGRFTPRESASGTHWMGGWVGPRAVLDTVVKLTKNAFLFTSVSIMTSLRAGRSEFDRGHFPWG